MPLFFIIFFAVYGAANFYVLRRFFQALPVMPDFLRYLLLAVLIFSALSYILVKALLTQNNSLLYDIFLWVGSFWFSILLYSFLFCFAVDLLRLLQLAANKTGLLSIHLPSHAGLYALAAGILFTAGMNIYGFINAGSIKVKKITVNSAQAASSHTLKILYFSDTHLTPVNNGRVMDQILAAANREKPDLILMGGDVVDDRPFRLSRHGLDKKLRALKAPLGAYTCPGNHEYITGYTEAEKFLSENGITVLRDKAVTLNGQLTIIGRDDSSGARFWGERRKSLAQLKENADPALPVIVLDHQPFNLAAAAKEGIALQLSGHTHHGQMFPINYITQKIYEQSWGYLKKGNSNFYISSGAGTWGPPIRTGSDSEIIIINLKY